MDLNEAEQLAHRLLELHGLTDWSFAFNRRKRALGFCRYGIRRIELSTHFVGGHEEPHVRDVILHEIAHALAGESAGHGPRWKATCRQIGASPQRLGEAEMPEGRWKATCPGCGRLISRFRSPLRKRQYACRTCGPEKGRLRFRVE